MTWHRPSPPKDDAWKAVTPEHIASLGQGLWLHCRCGHEAFAEPLALAKEHGVDPRTPLMTIGAKLKCSKCGERQAACWPRPYGNR